MARPVPPSALRLRPWLCLASWPWRSDLWSRLLPNGLDVHYLLRITLVEDGWQDLFRPLLFAFGLGSAWLPGRGDPICGRVFFRTASTSTTSCGSPLLRTDGKTCSALCSSPSALALLGFLAVAIRSVVASSSERPRRPLPLADHPC